MTALEQKIVPHLWFDKEAGEAARFYTAIFPNSRISGAVTIHDTPSGSTEIVSFVLCGQEFQAISAGPHFTLNPSISFTVNCATVEEVDALWAQLSEGGLALMPLDAYPFSPRFGWMQDRFGVSWQVTAAEGQEGQAPVLVPSLLFTGKNYGKAEEAVHFYTSIFEDAQVGQIIHNPPEADGKTTVMYADFLLENQRFRITESSYAHGFNFNEALSFIVKCDDQEEVDYFWEKLSGNGGEEGMCGWLSDKYGLSWQIVPVAMDEMMQADDAERLARVTQAFLQMKKLDIAALQRAYASE
ncbi:MAG: VOC family protein [Caldilineaceae bacterium]|jgi:predicted 3-demethylubiquinone-9 3-methyltransferase (glyoxalase superfamily)|nr:VOC family protein [Caldilineaceae bacterium]